MSHESDEKLAIHLNKYYSPQDLKISRKIFTNQVDKEGTCMVYLRLRRYNPIERRDDKERKMATGVRVKPKSWSSKKGEVLKSDSEWQTKNKKIQELEGDIKKYIFSPNTDYVFAQLKKEEFPFIEQIFPTPRLLKYRKNLVNYIEEYYDHRKKLKHPNGTIKEFKTVMNRIKTFDDENDQITLLKDVDILWSDRFEKWLTDKDYSTGTIEKTYTILKTVLNYYYERRKQLKIEIPEDFKYRSFKRGKKSVNNPNPLSQEQVMFLFNHKFEGKEARFEIVRIMVLIQCLTGCRFSDIRKLRPKHFERVGWLVFTPTKTETYNKEVEQPLNSFAKKLFEELNYDTSRFKMQNQPYNRAIKDMFKYLANKEEFKHLKFDTNYTSHNFRDTYISEAVRSGVNFKSILKWVGQSSYAIMDRYIKLSEEFNFNEMSKMWITDSHQQED